MKVMYEAGAAAVNLPDGTRVERGDPVEVGEGLGEQLLKQGWRLASAPAPSAVQPVQKQDKQDKQPAPKAGPDTKTADSAGKED